VFDRSAHARIKLKVAANQSPTKEIASNMLGVLVAAFLSKREMKMF
jgi:hypothetical protein